MAQRDGYDSMAQTHDATALHRRIAVLEQRLAQAEPLAHQESSAALKLQGVVEYAPLPVALSEMQSGRLINVNDAFCRAFAADRETLLGKTIIELGVYAAEKREQLLHELRAKGEVSGMEVEFTLLDGTVRQASLFSRLVSLPEGTYIVTMFQDITQQTTVQRELVEAKDTAEAANRAKSEFLANVSHEIRTPLNGVMGMLQLMQMCDLDPEQQEYVNHAQLASKNLTTILSDILDLAKMEAGKLRLTDTVFDINDVLNEVYGSFVYQFEDKGVLLVMEVHPETPRQFQGDPSRLRQVVFNLVGNAIKFTEHGSVTVSVTPLHSPYGPPSCFAAQGEGKQRVRLLISVADTGKGMTDAEVATIFEPFVQVDPASFPGNSGTGLGLHIVKEVVALMGGTVAISSIPGQGTTVYFTL